MRFGFKTSPQNTTWDDMLAVWKAADDIDVFESGWTFDHFYPIFSDPTGPCLEGWTVTTALAQATERLRVGLLVTGIHYRHPAVLANIATALDHVSHGRLEIGVGAGWNEEESGAYGIGLGPLGERFDRFDEALEVLVGLLTQETTTFAGRHYQLREARNEPKPVQRPHPPIVIGGTGPRRTLRAVARWAQHWNHPAATPDNWPPLRDALFAHCAALGRDPAEITLSTHLRYDPVAGPADLAERAAALADAGLHLGVVQLPPPHDPAVLEPIAQALRPLATAGSSSP
jgi:F420-dependent oxidoreductase-like protein